MINAPANKPPVIQSDSPTIDALGLESPAGIPSTIDVSNLPRQVTGVSFEPKTIPLPPLKVAPRKLSTQAQISADNEKIRTKAKEQQEMSAKMMLIMNSDLSRTEFMERMMTLLYSAGLLAGGVVLTIFTGPVGVIVLVIAGGSFAMSAVDACVSYKDWRNRANGKEGFTHRGDSLAKLIDAAQKHFGVEDSQKREKYADRASLAIRLVIAPFTAMHTAPHAHHPENPELKIDPVRLQEIRKDVHDKFHGRDIELSDLETLLPQGALPRDGVQDDWFAREKSKLSSDFEERLHDLNQFAERRIAERLTADEARLQAEEAENERLAAAEAEELVRIEEGFDLVGDELLAEAKSKEPNVASRSRRDSIASVTSVASVKSR
ncbi:MAG: hypothetical protein HAW66_00160 [Shewanella sp.]|nr:hypothetical protein [Shewanella sp.]